MGERLEYDETEAEQQAAVYRTADAADRRRHVRELLDLARGDDVLSIGCGPGFEPAEIASAVGDAGRVVGIDRSESMLALASDRCSDLGRVGLASGDAAALPVADDAVDAAVAVQVYEYLDDVEPALAELARVLRPGGRAVVCDADFASLVWRSGEPDRMERVLDAFDDHCPHPRLGSRLGPMLREAGLVVDRVEPHSILDTSLDDEAFATHLIDAVAAYAANHDAVGPDEARAWAADLRERDDAGETFFCYTQYLYRVRNPE